jgi:ADP-ribosylglycohydrolase
MDNSAHQTRLNRAKISLVGLSVGDAFGEQFFGKWRTIGRWFDNRQLPPEPWSFTDDTNMALSIVSVLEQYQEINQDALARSFAENYEPSRGYGMAMHQALPRIKRGDNWKNVAESLFNGEGSFGNGASMRVAPVGAYFADDLTLATENAKKSAEITHAHTEAAAGAIAVATATALAHRLRKEAAPAVHEFIELVHPKVPESHTRRGIMKLLSLPGEASVRRVASEVGNGSQVTTMDTVPYVIWCAGHYMSNYEEALWHTVSGGGDLDTTCAMVGGIVAMYVGRERIPQSWISKREALPTLPL